MRVPRVPERIADDIRKRILKGEREAIVVMTGRLTVAFVMQMLRDLVQRHTTAVGGHPPDRWAKLQRLSLRLHARLLDLIEAGDGKAAEDHWRNHLAEVERLIGRSTSTKIIDLFE